MKNQKKDWIECISYSGIGMFSAAVFLFGILFPKYLFVQECFADADEVYGSGEVMSIEDLRAMDLKVTSFSYECLKELFHE